MAQPTFLTITQQVAEHLRDGLRCGQWAGTIPGPRKLSAELGVNSKTIENALRLLEKEGFLVGQGRGRPRRIAKPGNHKATGMRIAILLGEAADRKVDFMVQLLHELQQTGHAATFAPHTLIELGRNVERVAQLVARNKADAWVVVAGSRDVLEWFAARELPVFALFGRHRGLSLAGMGPDKQPAMLKAARRLIELRHRRIVLLSRRDRRLPVPGAAEQALLKELAARGLVTGEYNLPDWEETIEGLGERLDSLFRLSPPTAMIVDEVPLFIAAQQFLARKRLQVPRDVSMLCLDPDPVFAWCNPGISHIRWDSAPVVRRIVHWAANVSRGTVDMRQTFTKAEFVEGGTIGPVPVGK